MKNCFKRHRRTIKDKAQFRNNHVWRYVQRNPGFNISPDFCLFFSFHYSIQIKPMYMTLYSSTTKNLGSFDRNKSLFYECVECTLAICMLLYDMVSMEHQY